MNVFENLVWIDLGSAESIYSARTAVARPIDLCMFGKAGRAGLPAGLRATTSKFSLRTPDSRSQQTGPNRTGLYSNHGSQTTALETYCARSHSLNASLSVREIL